MPNDDSARAVIVTPPIVARCWGSAGYAGAYANDYNAIIGCSSNGLRRIGNGSRLECPH